MIKKIEINAPAKINIGLNIINKREDGYHNLDTFFYPLYDFHDKLYIEMSDSFTFQCNIPEFQNEENLVIKAKNLLEKKFSTLFPVKVYLEKIIPAGAGLGGGSSDAAAILVSLNDMFRLKLSKDELEKLALELGSDVPFFIRSKPSIGKGRGEILELIDFEINYPVLIVNPLIHISTPEAFKNSKPTGTQIEINHYLKNKSIYELKNYLKNDFEEFAFAKYPEINQIKRTMEEHGAILSLMSGSGSTIFGIFETVEICQEVINNLDKKYFSKITNSMI